jgi:hypothetical protein
VTLRARWVTLSSLGDAESSLGDAKSSLGDAKSSLTIRARWVTLRARWVSQFNAEAVTCTVTGSAAPCKLRDEWAEQRGTVPGVAPFNPQFQRFAGLERPTMQVRPNAYSCLTREGRAAHGEDGSFSKLTGWFLDLFNMPHILRQLLGLRHRRYSMELAWQWSRENEIGSSSSSFTPPPPPSRLPTHSPRSP